MKDPIERQAAIDELKRISFSHLFEFGEYISEDTREIKIISSSKALEAIEALPPAQPEIVRCKDCKHWKDSDGVYRRGFDAESKCPLNIQEVYAGTFYCGYAERRTDEGSDRTSGGN